MKTAHRISREAQHAVIAEFADSNAILHDATLDPDYRAEIYRIIREQRKLRARRGEIVGSASSSVRGGGGFEREFQRHESGAKQFLDPLRHTIFPENLPETGGGD